MNPIETFRRYHDLIKAAMPCGEVGDLADFTPVRAVEGPLLTYHRLMRFQRLYESLSGGEFGRVDESLRSECDALEARVDSSTIDPVVVWSAMGLHVAGKIFIRDAWTDLASDAFGRLARGQTESGRFFPLSQDRGPEASWYDELVTLHAAASYAAQAEDRHVARAVAKSSSYILREIEPDHATGQPWGLFAFIWNEETRPLADQALHSVMMRKDSLDAVSLILLGDALYCLELFI